VEVEALHPSCERVGKSGQLQQVGRSGQEVTARAPVGIDASLDRQGEFRDSLDLVDRDALRQSIEKSLRVVLCQIEVVPVVEVDVGTLRIVMLGQGGLPALAGTQQADYRCILQRLRQHGGEVPGEVGSCV
jgi:hypothetical protein